MAEIIERMDDVENMPAWMQEAFRTGRVYHTCVAKVAELEAEVEEQKQIFKDLDSDYRQQVDMAVKLHKKAERLEGTLEEAMSVFHKIDEAEYAMVGGNLVKESISWETADSWFREIGKELNKARQALSEDGG